MAHICMLIGIYDNNPALFSLLLRLHGYRNGEIDYHALQIKKAGYGEPKHVVAINEHLLDANHARWYDLYTPDQLATWQISPTAQEQIATYLATLSDNTIINDPRLSYTLPLWAAALNTNGHEALIIVPFQHPFTFAQHMHQHYHMSTRLALALWTAYMLAIINYSRPYNHVFVNHDELFADWQKACQPLIAHIATDGIASHIVAQIDAYVMMRQPVQAHVHTVPTVIHTMEIYQIAHDLYTALHQSQRSESTIIAINQRFMHEIQDANYHHDIAQFDVLYHDTYLDKDGRIHELHLQIKDMHATHSNQIQALYTKHSQQIEQVSANFADALVKHEQQLSHMRSSFEQEIEHLNDKAAHLNEKIDTMQQEINWRADTMSHQQQLLDQLGWALRILTIKKRLYALIGKQ